MIDGVFVVVVVVVVVVVEVGHCSRQESRGRPQ